MELNTCVFHEFICFFTYLAQEYYSQGEALINRTYDKDQHQ